MRPHRVGLAGFVVALAAALAACGEREPEVAAAVSPEPAVATPASRSAEPSSNPTAALGRGFLVWESNRSGAWRIWTRALDGPARQLSPDERRRNHCCPHISPGGRWVAYLSLPREPGVKYARGQDAGRLVLMRPDGDQTRVAVEAARNYSEDRAVVWRSDDELIFIDGEGRTRSLEVESGRTRGVLKGAAEEYGWLADSTLRYATSGWASFSPITPDGRVAQRADLGGCQPYFSHDGRWGFWMAGAGGPVDRIDLETREIATVLRKSDPRLQAEWGYVYFPMLSADGRFLVFGASQFVHDHFRADYEIFLVETDPETFEVSSDAIRLTDDPATDRYPDVFVEPLPLGRLAGEAPFTVRLSSPDGGNGWHWKSDAGHDSEGATAEMTFTEPGTYRVSAERSGRLLEGRVRVAPARPPRPVDIAVVEAGKLLRVTFDEDVSLRSPEAALASGAGLGEPRLGASPRWLEIPLRDRLEGADVLHLAGLEDRAQRPNALAPVDLEIAPPRWPLSTNGLVFLWESGDAPNLIYDIRLDAERACSLERSGRARLDQDFALVLGGGAATASQQDADYVREACQRTNELTVEMVVTPAARSDGAIVTLGPEAGRRNFALLQRGESLLAGLRLGPPRDSEQIVELARIEPGITHHVAVTYRPGLLEAWVDGRSAQRDEELRGDFFHWRTRPLVLGDGAWGGTVEAVAIYSRVLGEEEIAENARRHRRQRAQREPLAALQVEATLVEASRRPTMSEIAPYREALAIDRYRVERVLEGSYQGGTLRVARWALQDGEPRGGATPGRRETLLLTPFRRNPQIEGTYLADTLDGGKEALFYLVEP